YCDGGKASQGLGISSKAASGADSVFTQVSITDLSIVGGTGTAANTNIFGTAKAYLRIDTSEVTGTEATPTMAGVYNSKGIVGVGKKATGVYFVDFETGLFNDINYIINGTASRNNTQTGVSVYEEGITSTGGARTLTRVYLGVVTGATLVDPEYINLSVFDNEPAEVALTTFGDVINYSGAAAWGNVEADGTINNGLNIASVTKTGSNTYDVVFTTPMPSDSYSVQVDANDQTSTALRNACVVSQSATGFSYNTFNSGGNANGYPATFTVQALNALPPKGGTGTDAWAACAAGGAIEGSFNIASVTKVSTGIYDVVFTTPMPTNKYSVVGSVGWSTTTGGGFAVLGAKTVNGFTAQLVSASGAYFDYAFNFSVNATNAQLPDTFTIEQFNSLVARVTALENP
ncbi:MAG: hypothetical protein GY881_13515, partial [Gammaproteobacteria bacterium]|nr:hypothetical protein [Gammaproteobacteria bacterium]